MSKDNYSRIFSDLPEKWTWYHLTDVAEVKFSNVDKKTYEGDNPVRLCNYMDVYNNEYVTDRHPFMLATAKDSEIIKFKLRKHDVLFTKDSETPDDIANSCVIADELNNVVCGYHLAMLRPKENISYGPFLSKMISSDTIHWQLVVNANGSTRFGLNLSAMNQIKIPLPPLSEQKKIAKILSSVDRSIEATKKLIAKLSDLKKALMQELFTKGIGHTRFKDSPLGRIPEEWEVVSLGALIDKLDSGVSVNSEDRHKKTRELGILKTSCLTGGFFNILEHKTVLSTEFGRVSCPVRGNSIIISRMNTPNLVGENAFVSSDYKDLFLPDRLWQTVISNKNVFVKWLAYNLQTAPMKQELSLIATGTSGSMKNISKPNFLSLKVALPSIKEQNKIASILSAEDKKIEKAKSRLEKLKDLKKGLMQDLLTGKVRV